MAAVELLDIVTDADRAAVMALYERYGFVTTGDTMDEEVVLRLDLPVRPG